MKAEISSDFPAFMFLPAFESYTNSLHLAKAWSDTNPVFKPEALIAIAFYINGRNDEPGDGVFYIEDIKGVQMPALSTK